MEIELLPQGAVSHKNYSLPEISWPGLYISIPNVKIGLNLHSKDGK